MLGDRKWERDFGCLTSRGERVLLAYLDARNRPSDDSYVIINIENLECSYTHSCIDEKILPENSSKRF